jgi:hypothetical protein
MILFEQKETALDTIYTSVMFLGPGLIIEAITKYRDAYREEKTKRGAYQSIFEIVANSAIVFIAAMALFNLVSAIPWTPIAHIVTLEKFAEALNHIPFLVLYLAVIVALCFLWMLILENLKSKIFWKLRNVYMHRKVGAKVTYDGTVWEEIFFPKIENGEDRPWLVVSIFKDGSYIVSGIIDKYPSGNDKRREYAILHSDVVERVLRDERDKPEEGRILWPVYKDYFDQDSGVSIKFYSYSESRLVKEIEKHQCKTI